MRTIERVSYMEEVADRLLDGEVEISVNAESLFLKERSDSKQD